MTYIALALTTIMAIWFAVAHEEQKLKTEKYMRLAIRLKKENDAWRDIETQEEFEYLARNLLLK